MGSQEHPRCRAGDRVLTYCPAEQQVPHRVSQRAKDLLAVRPPEIRGVRVRKPTYRPLMVWTRAGSRTAAMPQGAEEGS